MITWAGVDKNDTTAFFAKLKLLTFPKVQPVDQAKKQQVDDLKLNTFKEAAELLSVSRSKLYKLVEDGDLVAVKLGQRGDMRIARRELERFLMPKAKSRPKRSVTN